MHIETAIGRMGDNRELPPLLVSFNLRARARANEERHKQQLEAFRQANDNLQRQHAH
jgi:hypothetical protein